MWYWFFRGLFNVIFRVFFRLKVEGRENVPQKTNFIVAANHASFLDSLLLGVAIPKKIHWIIFWKIHQIPWLGWLIHISKSLPTGKASDKAAGLLMKNRNVGLFPEGTCSRDGKLGEFRRGAALLALKTGRPVLPCVIFGAYEALPRGAKFPRFLPLKVKIGRPVYLLKEFQDVIDDVFLQEGILKIRNAMTEMISNG